MEANFDFGMIGLGVMGSNLLLNLADHGFAVIGFDLKPQRGKALEDAAKEGTTVKGVNSLEQLVLHLKTPRKIMMLVPAGKPVDDVIAQLLPLLSKDDIIIDGGNSFYKDTLHRITYLQDKGLHFVGMGVSGGEMGARTGPSMMPGGDPAAFRYLKPLLEAIAAKAGNKPCVAYMGNGAAGHYVKMVHNGIEYAMMQLISEVYDILRRGAGWNNEQLHLQFRDWNDGPLQSFLIQITAEVFKTGDTETSGNEDYLVDKILDQAGSKGTGKWTSQEAMDLPIAIPTIDAAVAARNLSVVKAERIQAAKLHRHTPRRIEEGEMAAGLEQALLFSFLIAYGQGLAMLGRASEVLKMQIPLPDVVQVWKAGCIIRSALLHEFSGAFARAPQLSNILLDSEVAELLRKQEPGARRMAALAIEAGIPVPALSSALAYYDGFCSERLPTNLIQAQRDYFGAHTYQRIDREGVFHTEWNQ